MKKNENSKYYLAAVIALITALVYLPSLRNEFVNWDDGLYVFENPFLTSPSLQFVKWAFSTIRTGNWHPLTWISYSLDYTLWALNPMGYHLTNVVLHALNTMLVVLLTIRLLQVFQRTSTAGRASDRFLFNRTMWITACAAGLLFGLHPLHVESVAWVSERKDLLSALFFLLSIDAYISYASDKTYKAYFLSLGFFTLALISKPMAVSLPAVLLLLDWYPLDRIHTAGTLRAALREKLPFIALSIVAATGTLAAQQTEGALQLMESTSWPTRTLVALKALVVYLGKMIVPLHLVPFYPYPKNPSLFSGEYLVPLVLATGITVICAASAKKQKVWLTAWGYYVVTLMPVLGIVQAGGQAMADRYTYLPSVGPFLIAGLGGAWVWDKVSEVLKGGFSDRLFGALMAVVLTAALSMGAVKQIGLWRNSLVLWNYVVEQEPDAARAYNNRGLAYEKLGLYDKALTDMTKAISLDPADKVFYNNRGIVFGRMGRSDEAFEDFGRAIALDPSYAKAYDNLGATLGRAGMSDKALAAFNQAIAIDPDLDDAYLNRGTTYALLGQYARALDDYDKAVLLNRNNAKGFLLRGKLNESVGKSALAIPDFQKACDLGNRAGCDALESSIRRSRTSK